MANRYHRKEVLEELYNKAKTVCENVFVTTRPTATAQMKSFIVVRLPQGFRPTADTHNLVTIQLLCYVRDKQDGVEDVKTEETLVDGILNLFPYRSQLLHCGNTPLILEAKSDGMGFHSTIIQLKAVVVV